MKTEERILDKDGTGAQNEWARGNIEPDERMICLVCGRMVSQHWMVWKLKRKVGGRCAPCYFEKIKEKLEEST